MCATAGTEITETFWPHQDRYATTEAFASYGMTSASVAQPVQAPKDALPGYGGLEVSIASTALNGLEDAVRYLVTYPYECTEQLLSKAMPALVAADPEQVTRPDFAPIAQAFSLLRQRQNGSGGFGDLL